jgi:hypothetical protein
MSRLPDRLAIEGEALPPLPSLEQEAETVLQMVGEGRRLTDALRRANNRAHRLNEQIDDLCLALGYKLNGMRQRVEAGEAGALAWWEWFSDFIPDISRKHAERWMSIAAQVEPATAAVEYRNRDAAYHRAARARQRLGQPLSDVRGESEDGDQSEPDEPEPRRESAQDPLKIPLDALVEAVACRDRILDLMPLMTAAGREQFRKTLVEEVEALERALQ